MLTYTQLFTQNFIITEFLCKRSSSDSLSFFILNILKFWRGKFSHVRWLDPQDFCCLYFWINQIFAKVNSDNYNKMKSKFIPLSFLIACFYWKFRKELYLLKKYIAMNPENHWVNIFFFKFLYLGFISFCTLLLRLLL